MTEKSYLGEFGLTATMHRLPTPAPETMYIYPMTPDSMCMALVIKSGEKQETFTCYTRHSLDLTTESLFVSLMYQIWVTSDYEDWIKIGLADVIGEESARAWYAYGQECSQKLAAFLGEERAKHILNRVVGQQDEDKASVEQKLNSMDRRYKATVSTYNIAELAKLANEYIGIYLEFGDINLVDNECLITAGTLLQRIQEIVSKPPDLDPDLFITWRNPRSSHLTMKDLLNREQKEPDL